MDHSTITVEPNPSHSLANTRYHKFKVLWTRPGAGDRYTARPGRFNPQCEVLAVLSWTDEGLRFKKG